MADVWSHRLSEYLDDELTAEERGELDRHLEACADCREILQGLRDVVRHAAGLVNRPPTQNLWTGIEASLGAARGKGRQAMHPVSLAAAGLALLLLGAWLSRIVGSPVAPVSTGSEGATQFALLLHESSDFLKDSTPQERTEIVARYRAWSQAVAEVGGLVDGQKLVDEDGWILRGEGLEQRSPHGGGIGGYFIIRAPNYDEALRIARGCPHLALGGWIEVRRIERS